MAGAHVRGMQTLNSRTDIALPQTTKSFEVHVNNALCIDENLRAEVLHKGVLLLDLGVGLACNFATAKCLGRVS